MSRDRMVFNYPLPDEFYSGADYAQSDRRSVPSISRSSHAFNSTPRMFRQSEPRCIAPELLNRSATYPYEYHAESGSSQRRYVSSSYPPSFNTNTLSMSPPRMGSESLPLAHDARYVVQGSGSFHANNRRSLNPSSPDNYEGEYISSNLPRRTSSNRPECSHEGCVDHNGRPRSFSRTADLRRHEESFHRSKTIDCPRPRCYRKGEDGFTRKDHLDEHLRGYHKLSIPKRGSTQ